MWKPASVVPEHRRRATVIWGALLIAIAGYTAWQIVTLHRKFDNPSTNYSVSDDLFEFPFLDICVWEGKGCDASLNESSCIDTAGFTVYDPCGNKTEGVGVRSQQWSNCVAFNLPLVDMEGFKNGSCVSVTGKPLTTVTMAWYSSYAPGEEDYYRETVGVFLGNGTTRQYVAIPYSRVVISPDSIVQDDVTFIEADVTLGKTIRNHISGNSSTSYPVLSFSTGNFVDQARTDSSGDLNGDGSSYAVGYLFITLTQGTYSLTEVTDVNPLDIGTLLGNIGGFWELLLVTWGLCFFAASTQSPTQRGRDFTQPIRRGKQIIDRKRRSRTQPTTVASEGCEEQAHWITAKGGRQESTGRNIRRIPPVSGRPPMSVEASVFRNPIEQDYPRRSFRISLGPTVTGESAVATSDNGSTTQQTQQLTYSGRA